jgi:hyaluronate lyase
MVSLALSGPQSASASDEYDALRERWKEWLVGGSSYSVTDPHIAAQINSITTRAQQLWTTMIKTPNRATLWNGYNFGHSSSTVTEAYNNLRDMAMAYNTRGSVLEGNTALRDDIIGGLDWMHANIYYEGGSQYQNWWHWQIGAPMALNDATILMYDDLTAAQIENYMDAVHYSQPTVTMTGANRAWESIVIGVRGVIVKDSAQIQHATAGLSNIFDYVTRGDGFYADGSFIQHSYFPYTGGYGISLIETVSSLMYLVGGSSFEITDPDRLNVYRWIYDSFEPLIYKGEMMDMVRGREIVRGWQSQSHNAMRSIILLSEIAPAADASALKSMIKQWMTSDTYSSLLTFPSIRIIELASAIMSNSAIAPKAELIGHYSFANMDRAVQLRPGYGFGISMHSSRIGNYESINSENKKGWHTADGMTFLYNNDLAQYRDNFWPTVDSYRLPGTTVLRNTTVAGGRSDKNWVGGAGIGGLYGVAGMELHPIGQSLNAKKSWFMFDDEIVALGSGITSTDGIAAETIAENRKLNGNGDNALTVNGTAKSTALGWSEQMTGVQYAHLAGSVPGSDIGYYFPGTTAVTGLREARTGNWKEINGNSGTSTTPHTRNYLSLGLQHGVNPVNAAYSYVTLPNKTNAQVSAYASSPDISILENSTDAHAVKENGLNIVGVNFWNDTVKTVDFITSNRKASVMTKETAGEIDLSVADPTQAGRDTINIELNRSATRLLSADPGVVVTQLSPTIKLSVSVVGAKGQAFKAKFATTGPVVPLPAPPVMADPYIIEGESLSVIATNKSHTIVNSSSASGGQDSMFNANAINDYIDYKVNVPRAGTYKMTLRLYRTTNSVLYQLQIGNENHGSPFDSYSASANYFDVDLGEHTFTGPGDRIFRFTLTGTTVGKIRTDYIKLEKTDTEEPPSLPEGLVSYWTFNEASGTVAADLAGNHHGAVSGASWTAGQVGNALSLNGANAHVAVPHSTDFSFSSSESFTISAWVYVPALPGAWKGIITKGRDSSPWYGLWIGPDNRWTFGGDANVKGSVATTGWQHVTIVQNGAANQRIVYVDGASTGTGSARNAANTGDLWIGGAKSVNEYFNGTIDDVRFYNIALSAADVLELYNETSQ